MSTNPNSGMSPPPIGTPIRNGSLQAPAMVPDDLPPTPWAAWFNAVQLRLTVLQVTQANLPTNFGPGDTGRIVYVTDYAHLLMWTGSGWTWGPGDSGSGMMQLFEVDPTGAGWHLYDGTANVKYLKSDGTTGTVNLPDLTSVPANAAYPKGGSPNSGPNAATAPTLSGQTDNASTGVTIPANTGSASLISGAVAGGVSVASGAHTHPEGPVTDPQHHHTLSAASVSATGEPRNIVRRPWFRQ